MVLCWNGWDRVMHQAQVAQRAGPHAAGGQAEAGAGPHHACHLAGDPPLLRAARC